MRTLAVTISSRSMLDCSHIALNCPPWSYNANGVSNACVCQLPSILCPTFTDPASMTRILSQDMMVRNRCAMQRIVFPVNSRWIVAWILASVSRSGQIRPSLASPRLYLPTAAVASSSQTISTPWPPNPTYLTPQYWPAEDVSLIGRIALTSFTNARARLIKERSPTPVTGLEYPRDGFPHSLRFDPSSSMTVSRVNRFLALATSSSITHARRRASYKWASAYVSNGSKLLRKVPANNSGSCGMIEILDLKVPSPILLMSTPSILMKPDESLAVRNAEMVDLLD